MKVKKYILIIFALLSLVFIAQSVLIGLEWARRISFNYNSEGIFFDPSSFVSYDSDAIIGYGVSTLVFAILAILFFVKTFNIWKKFMKSTDHKMPADSN